MKKDQLEAIEKHGRQLLAIFPNATEQDPVKLCKKLRRLEKRGERFAVRLCSEYMSEEADDREHDGILGGVDRLLNWNADNIPVFLNRDPRGYSLKINDDYMREHNLDLHRDFGGYGIIAPEIN